MSVGIKVGVAILCLLGCMGPASAQYGVSNARDGSGNLIRDTGANSIRNLPQPPVNNRPGRQPPSSPNTTDQGRNNAR